MREYSNHLRMKRIKLIATLSLLSIAQFAFARDGYHITLKIPDVKEDSMVFLVHYYGKNRPTVFKTDSARFDKNGVAEFRSTSPEFTGGIYIMLLSNTRKDFEFLINKGDDISISATMAKLPEGVKFKNSPENDRFLEYVGYLKDYAKKQDGFVKDLANAKTNEDSSKVRKKAGEVAKELTAWRRNYVKANPHTLLSTIFNAMEVPEVPEGPHYLEDGKTKDSTFAYHYYKSHYWDGFDFQDDRLIYTPLYDARIEEYMSKMVLPWTDSIEKESDMLLKKARGTKDMFHYTLWWLTQYVENSKVMGMSDVFVYLVENYYMKGDAFWLTNDELSKYLDRARKMAPNVIGNIAPELKLPNVTTKKEENLFDVKSKYTVVVFYSPNCGHCQHEMPKLDSAYTADLKAKGVKIFTVATEGDEKAINDFITKYNMGTWTNTWDPDHTSDYHDKYDVYSTPTIYLLDDKKIIKGKRLDHSNLGGLIEMIDKKNKKDKEKGAKE